MHHSVLYSREKGTSAPAFSIPPSLNPALRGSTSPGCWCCPVLPARAQHPGFPITLPALPRLRHGLSFCFLKISRQVAFCSRSPQSPLCRAGPFRASTACRVPARRGPGQHPFGKHRCETSHAVLTRAGTSRRGGEGGKKLVLANEVSPGGLLRSQGSYCGLSPV